MPHPIYKTGATVPLVADKRDYQWRDSGLAGAAPAAYRLPESLIMPAMLQQHLDCGPCAVAAMMYCAAGGKMISPRYHYLKSRQLGNTFPADSGTNAPNNMAIAAKGMADLASWVYEGDINETPSAATEANAPTNKATYFACPALADIESAIASGHPVCLHVYATDHWYNPVATPDGSFEVAQGGNSVGGHFVTAIGYDMNRKCADGTMGAVLILNSWGAGWGARGLAWLPLYWLTPAGGHAGSRYALTTQVTGPSPTIPPEKPMNIVLKNKAEVLPLVSTIPFSASGYGECKLTWTTDPGVIATVNGGQYNEKNVVIANGRYTSNFDKSCALTVTFMKPGEATTIYTVNFVKDAAPTPPVAPDTPAKVPQFILYSDKTWGNA